MPGNWPANFEPEARVGAEKRDNAPFLSYICNKVSHKS